MSEVESNLLCIACSRIVLDVPEADLAGYLAFCDEERHYTAIALREQEALVRIWYRLFNLYGQAALGIPVQPDEDNPAIPLSARFLAASGATSKLIFEAALAGHYTQAFMMVRHLFETWVRLAYLKFRPDMAEGWYVVLGRDRPEPPSRGAMHSELRKRLNGTERKALEAIIATIERMDTMAHPSPHTLLQTMTDREDAFKIAGTYIPDLCHSALYEGASGLRLLLGQWQNLAQMSESWVDEYQSVRTALSALASPL